MSSGIILNHLLVIKLALLLQMRLLSLETYILLMINRLIIIIARLALSVSIYRLALEIDLLISFLESRMIEYHLLILL